MNGVVEFFSEQDKSLVKYSNHCCITSGRGDEKPHSIDMEYTAEFKQMFGQFQQVWAQSWALTSALFPRLVLRL